MKRRDNKAEYYSASFIPEHTDREDEFAGFVVASYTSTVILRGWIH